MEGAAGASAPAAKLPTPTLVDMLQEVDPHCTLEPDAEQMLLNIAEDFVEELTSTACELARHRGSDALEAKDVAFCLKKYWNTTVPGSTETQ